MVYNITTLIPTERESVMDGKQYYRELQVELIDEFASDDVKARVKEVTEATRTTFINLLVTYYQAKSKRRRRRILHTGELLLGQYEAFLDFESTQAMISYRC